MPEEPKLIDKSIWVQDGDEVITMQEAHQRYGEGKFPESLIGNCFTFAEYGRLPLASPPGWIEEGILPLKSKLLLFGEPKVGKSFMAMQMGYDIAENHKWLRFNTGEQDARVLYIQAEISEIELQSRIGFLPSEFAYAETIHSARLLGEQVGILTKRIEAIKPDVLILDPLYMFISGDLTEIADVTACNNVIDQIITEYDCSVIVVHHSRKPREESTQGIMEALGSIAITAFYDSILWFEKLNNEASLLHFMLRNAKSPEALFIVQNDKGLWQDIEISFEGSVTAQTLAESTNYSLDLIKAWLDRQVQIGKVQRNTWGSYEKRV